MKLSAVLIVKNEEKMLGQCLESISGIDEIIVVDTGSSDDTIKIAMEHGAEIFEDYKWNDNFAEARNHANKKATGDWILSIDADEILEVNGIANIRQAIDNALGRSLDVLMHSGKNSFFFPRLFKNDSDIFWKGAVHNYLSIAEKVKTDIHIEYRYSPEHAKDPDRALRILKKEVNKNPNATREIFYLGRELLYRKQWPSAIYWLLRYLEHDTWGPERGHAYVLLCKCYINTLEYQKARVAASQALLLNSNHKEAIKLLAELSGPGNKKRWNQFAETATNEDVLFKSSA